MPHFNLELSERILLFFFLNSVLNCLLMSYIKTPIPDTFLGEGGGGENEYLTPLPHPRQGGGTSSKPPSLISRAFPSYFSCSIFFILLDSCFLFLCFDASLNSSCDIELWNRKERDKKVRRRKVMWNCSLFSFLL